MPDAPRFFTLDEANRTLPLVRRIMRDILEAHPELEQQLSELRRLQAQDPGAQGRERAQQLHTTIDKGARRINSFIQELHQIGCLFKGFDPGLVDFYCLYRNRPIFLCWQSGEDTIHYWHELDAGYAGRQPLPPDMKRKRSRTPTGG